KERQAKTTSSPSPTRARTRSPVTATEPVDRAICEGSTPCFAPSRSRSCRAAASGYRFAPSREATAASRTAAIGGKGDSFEETWKRRTPSSAGGLPGTEAGGSSRTGRRRMFSGGAGGSVRGAAAEAVRAEEETSELTSSFEV